MSCFKFFATFILLSFISLMNTAPLLADVTVDTIFSSHMVLQQGMKVPIWGTAKKGETVSVSFRGQKKETKGNDDGSWMLSLDPLEVGEPSVMTIVGDNTISFDDVLVGEVWLAAGQSNLVIPVGGGDPFGGKWIKEAHPHLRLHTAKGWVIAEVNTIKPFSALGFYFAYSLQKELGVPVGIIVRAVNGQPSRRWIPKDAIKKSPDKALNLIDVEENIIKSKAYREYELACKKAKADGSEMPTKVEKVFEVGDLWDRDIKPLVPFAIRGVLWDQGESDSGIDKLNQFSAMKSLIDEWRYAWGQGDFPFLHVQKRSGRGCAFDPTDPMFYKSTPFKVQPEAPGKAEHGRLSRSLNSIRVTEIANAPLVTTMDLGPGTHPVDKSSYGLRACRVALGAVYGRKIAISGPQYKSHKIQSNTIRVSYMHVGSGLVVRHSEKLQGFEIAGADKKWDWAEAKIDGNDVVLTNKNIPEPKYLRYGVVPDLMSCANLFNKDGLPALIFYVE